MVTVSVFVGEGRRGFRFIFSVCDVFFWFREGLEVKFCIWGCLDFMRSNWYFFCDSVVYFF